MSVESALHTSRCLLDSDRPFPKLLTVFFLGPRLLDSMSPNPGPHATPRSPLILDTFKTFPSPTDGVDDDVIVGQFTCHWDPTLILPRASDALLSHVRECFEQAAVAVLADLIMTPRHPSIDIPSASQRHFAIAHRLNASICLRHASPLTHFNPLPNAVGSCHCTSCQSSTSEAPKKQ